MNELVSNTSLIRTLALIEKQTENLRAAGQAITKWLETSPREKTRRAKIALTALHAWTHRQALALLFISTIDTENARPPISARLMNWLHAHAPPHDFATKAEQARVMT